jgi:metal-responsive CopG/Arc/MetJ family transcriptional regulator
MENKQPKRKTLIAIRLETKQLELLDAFANDWDINRSQAVRKALNEVLNRNE